MTRRGYGKSPLPGGQARRNKLLVSWGPLVIAPPVAGSLLAPLRCAGPCQSRSPATWPPSTYRPPSFNIPTPFASCFRTFRSVALSIFGRSSFTPWATARLLLLPLRDRQVLGADLKCSEFRSIPRTFQPLCGRGSRGIPADSSLRTPLAFECRDIIKAVIA